MTSRANKTSKAATRKTSRKSSTDTLIKNNRIFLIIVCIVALVSFCLITYAPLKYFYIANRTSGLLNAQLEAVQERNDIIAADIEYYADTSILEDIARDKLGLAKAGEIVLEVQFEPGELTQKTKEKFLPPEVSISEVVESQQSAATEVLDNLFGFSEHDVFTF